VKLSRQSVPPALFTRSLEAFTLGNEGPAHYGLSRLQPLVALTRSFVSSRHSSLATRHFLKSFRIRTSTTRARNSFRFCTSLERPDLRIPKDLRPTIFSRNSFIFCTCRHVHKCGKQTTYNPIRIRTYKKRACNSFGIRTYKNPRGPSRTLSAPLPYPQKEGPPQSPRHTNSCHRVVVPRTRIPRAATLHLK
jgi:hypothetical protein